MLGSQNNRWSKIKLNKLVLANPVFKPEAKIFPKVPVGFISLELEKSFLHKRYRKQLIKNTLKFTKGDINEPIELNEPYIPTIRSIRLSYKASSEIVDIGAVSLQRFAEDDIQFFHLAYFGQRREHGYLRQKFEYVRDKTVTLLPNYRHQGELLIGLENLSPGDSVSLLFQVAEGSADPTLSRQKIQWAVLADNYWKILTSQQVFLDSTNQLLTSGIIKFTLPAEATTENILMPNGLIWLKAAVPDQVDAVCQFIAIEANAIEVVFNDQGNDRNHLLHPFSVHDKN